MKRLLLCVALCALASCAMTPGETTAAVAASVPPILAMLGAWREAGLLSPEQYAEAMATFQQLGASFGSIMELIRIWGAKTEAVSQAQLSPEAVVGISTGITGLGGLAINSLRNRKYVKATTA